MRAAHREAGGPPVEVASVPVIEDKEIGQTRGRIIALLRREGWSFVALGKLFRCSDRWIRAEFRDYRRYNSARNRPGPEDEDGDEGPEVSLAI